MTRITFREVAIRGIRRWKGEDGRTHQQTKKFFQTINPFNKNAQGEPKGAEEIMREIKAERDAWQGMPRCQLCPEGFTNGKCGHSAGW